MYIKRKMDILKKESVVKKAKSDYFRKRYNQDEKFKELCKERSKIRYEKFLEKNNKKKVKLDKDVTEDELKEYKRIKKLEYNTRYRNKQKLKNKDVIVDLDLPNANQLN